MNFIGITLVRIIALFNTFTSFEQSGLLFILNLIDLAYSVSLSFILPNSYSALDGDLLVQVLQNDSILSPNSLYIHLFRFNKSDKHFCKRIKFRPDINQMQLINTTNTISHITIGCEYFLFGGEYQLQIIDESADNNISQELNAYENFQVDWPEVKLNVSYTQIPTYPDENIQVELAFSNGKCRKRRLATVEQPEFWLEVLYCRHNSMCNGNQTKIHTLYIEQVKFLQNKTSFNLSCDIFGMAGHYVIQVRPLTLTEKILAKVSIQADWNEKFVFNVLDRAIMPCDPYDGIGVLFEYPSCIDFIIRDRIRIYGKLRANVMAINAPTSLEHIIDERIEVNQHKKYFDCDLFTERYVEYCFAYITQAMFGAVAEIRMDCVPTLPVNPWDHGGWGPWSEWTPCSSTCPGGQRHRYRFCDSPVPRYGARYCEGYPIETQECGQNNTNIWECLYGDANTRIIDSSGNYTTNFNNEAISKCACGCLVELSPEDDIKLLAFSMKSCLDNKLFWIIQANATNQIKLVMEFVGLPCLDQFLRVRNGHSVTSQLIGDYRGVAFNRSNEIISTGNEILIEFLWNSKIEDNQKCNGRFLARCSLFVPTEEKAIETKSDDILQLKELALIQVVAFLFAALIVTMSTILVIHYLVRYRKYKLTENTEYYSPAHTPQMDIDIASTEVASPPSRAISTTTLISEVVYFVKIRRRTEIKHKILRESTISEKSNHITNNKNQEKQPVGSLSARTSLSTQTIYKVNSPLYNQDDVSSIASYPCYKSKIPFRYLETNKQIKSKEKDMHKNDSSRDVTDISNVSSPVGGVQGASLSSAGSDVTLTSGCYSTQIGTINTATIRSTNQKECKDKRNLEKILSRPQSEFSLGNAEDFELDYYDYNVLNTTDVPGSYLGMDPAYLIWIPPFEAESSFSKDANRIDDAKQLTSEDNISSLYQFIDTGSNTESPSSHREETLSPTLSFRATQKRIASACHITKNLYQGVVAEIEDEGSPKQISHIPQSNIDILHRIEQKLKSAEGNEIGEEKETTVTKSPSRNISSFYDDEDIQFVDD